MPLTTRYSLLFQAGFMPFLSPSASPLERWTLSSSKQSLCRPSALQLPLSNSEPLSTGWTCIQSLFTLSTDNAQGSKTGLTKIRQQPEERKFRARPQKWVHGGFTARASVKTRQGHQGRRCTAYQQSVYSSKNNNPTPTDSSGMA